MSVTPGAPRSRRKGPVDEGSSKARRPPRLAEWLLSLALPREEREGVLGDLAEALATRAPRSRKRDLLWYWAQAILTSSAFAGHRIRNALLRVGSGRKHLTRHPPFRGSTPRRFPGAQGGTPMRAWLQDLRFAFRSFAKRPGFTVSAVAIMALGIGATATIFSVVDAVLLRPLPYPDSPRLVFFDHRPHAFPSFIDWRDHLTSFDAIGALSNSEGSVVGDGSPVHAWIANVTPDLLPMLGARARLGRVLTQGDFGGDKSAVVLSYAFWRRTWGSEPGVVGRQIRVDGTPVLVAGILDPDFVPPKALIAGPGVDVWRPVDEAAPGLQSRNSRTFAVVAHLRKGVSEEAAQSEINALTASLAKELPSAFVSADGTVASFPIVPLKEATVRGVSDMLFLLLGAVGLMLLIACANVANLFLARGTARSGEMALRVALGASNFRLIRQLLTESMALGLVGGTGGIALTYLGVGLFKRLGPADIPRLAAVSVDIRILAFALGLSLVTGVLCGVYPALQAGRSKGPSTLTEVAGRTTSGRRKRGLRGLLVVTELALTMILLTSSGLLLRSMMERARVRPGLDPEHLVVLPMQLGSDYTREARVQLARDLRRRFGEIPGVRSVAAGWTMPFVFPPRACCWTGDVWPEGGTNGGNLPVTWIRPVTPAYFSTLGVQLVSGREFTQEDIDNEAPVAVINARLAMRLFGTEAAAGRSVVVGGDDAIRVVGVAGNLHHGGLEEQVGETLYLPYVRNTAGIGLFQVAVRSALPVESLAPGLRKAMAELDPNLAPQEIVSMRQLIARSLGTPRFLSVLFGAFASLALVLACSGIYASMLYTVGQRKKEMGVRLALGANASQVWTLILRDGTIMTVLGLAIGAAGSLVMSRAWKSLVWGVSPTDGSTYAVVCILLAFASLAACLVPARRAARADPVQSLRDE
jgi:putative ABC transport system permease protein